MTIAPVSSTEMGRAIRCCSSRRLAAFLFPAIAQLLLAPVAETCASFSFCEHSSQHTSTVLPPILTLMGFASSLQSQAAQVFSNITFALLYPRSEYHQ